jgi:hypothetical protein
VSHTVAIDITIESARTRQIGENRLKSLSEFRNLRGGATLASPPPSVGTIADGGTGEAVASGAASA